MRIVGKKRPPYGIGAKLVLQDVDIGRLERPPGASRRLASTGATNDVGQLLHPTLVVNIGTINPILLKSLVLMDHIEHFLVADMDAAADPPHASTGS